MELKITGRPGKIIEKDSVVLLEMVGFPPEALPKGLPPVPNDKLPACLAILSRKQWRKIQKKVQNEDERLEIKGYPVYDEELKQITMLVVSTKSVPRLGGGAPQNRGPRRDGPRRDGPRRDGPRRDGPRRDGPGRDGPRRDGPGRW